MLLYTPMELFKKGLAFAGFKDNGYVDYSREWV